MNKNFVKIWFAHIFFFIKRLFVKKNKTKYILLINYNNLGDLVCDTPSIRNIRKNYPKHHIVMLVRNKSCINFMSLCPYIDTILEIPHSKAPFKQYIKFSNMFLKYKFSFSMQFTRPFNEYYRTYLPYILNIRKRYGLIQAPKEYNYKFCFTHKYAS